MLVDLLLRLISLPFIQPEVSSGLAFELQINFPGNRR
jgi:hypothetical protein